MGLTLDGKRKTTSAEKTTQAADVLAIRLLVADEVGQIKALEGSSERLGDTKQVASWGQLSRASGTRCFEVASSSTDDTVLFATGGSQGRCQIAEAHSGEVVGSVDAREPSIAGADQQICGLHFVWKAVEGMEPQGRKPWLLSCTMAGLVRVHAPPNETEEGGDPSSRWQEVAAMQMPPNVLATAVDDGAGMLAVGARGSNLSVWDLRLRERCYLAKGPKPNGLGLVDEPWGTAVAFLPGSGGRRVVLGTGRGKLLVHDRAQLRPRRVAQFREGKITALAPEPDGLRCWAADARGEIACLDVEAGSLQQVLRGSGGSVRSLSLHPSLPLIASAGLDRFLRIHSLDTRKLLARVYLKQQLLGAAFCPPRPAAEVGSASLLSGEQPAGERPEGELQLKPALRAEIGTRRRPTEAAPKAVKKQKKAKRLSTG